MSKKLRLFANISYFAVILVFVGVRICSSLGVFSFMGKYADTIMGFVTQVGIILLLPLFMFKLLSKKTVKQTFDFCGYKKTSWKVLVGAVLLGVVVFFLNFYVSNFFQFIIQGLGYKPATGGGESLPATWWALLLDIFTTAVLAGVCEETLHRGLLLKGNSSIGINRAILLSGLLFGLLHMNIMQFFYATLIGIFLGYLCVMCNSIFPCMIVHFMNNALSVFFSFAARKGWAIGGIFDAISNFIGQNIVLGGFFFILLLALFVFIGFEITKYMAKESFRYSFSKRQKQLANLAIRDSYFKQIEDIKNGGEQPEPLFKTENKTIYLDFKQFVNYVGKNVSSAVLDEDSSNDESQKNVQESQKKSDGQKKKFSEKILANIDLKNKILIYGCIALGVIVTFMTYLWGVLR